MIYSTERSNGELINITRDDGYNIYDCFKDNSICIESKLSIHGEYIFIKGQRYEVLEIGVYVVDFNNPEHDKIINYSIQSEREIVYLTDVEYLEYFELTSDGEIRQRKINKILDD